MKNIQKIHFERLISTFIETPKDFLNYLIKTGTYLEGVRETSPGYTFFYVYGLSVGFSGKKFCYVGDCQPEDIREHRTRSKDWIEGDDIIAQHLELIKKGK